MKRSHKTPSAIVVGFVKCDTGRIVELELWPGVSTIWGVRAITVRYHMMTCATLVFVTS